MRRKDGKAKYVVTGGHSVTVEYNHEANTSTTTRQYYRRIEQK